MAIPDQNRGAEESQRETDDLPQAIVYSFVWTHEGSRISTVDRKYRTAATTSNAAAAVPKEITVNRKQPCRIGVRRKYRALQKTRPRTSLRARSPPGRCARGACPPFCGTGTPSDHRRRGAS